MRLWASGVCLLPPMMKLKASPSLLYLPFLYLTCQENIIGLAGGITGTQVHVPSQCLQAQLDLFCWHGTGRQAKITLKKFSPHLSPSSSLPFLLTLPFQPFWQDPTPHMHRSARKKKIKCTPPCEDYCVPCAGLGDYYYRHSSC